MCRYTYYYTGTDLFVEYAPCTYDGSIPNVHSTAIYGVESTPKSVYTYGYFTPLDFVYEAATKSLVIFVGVNYMPSIPASTVGFFISW